MLLYGVGDIDNFVFLSCGDRDGFHRLPSLFFQHCTIVHTHLKRHIDIRLFKWVCLLYKNKEETMEIRSLDHNALLVRDVEKSRYFYGQVLGMQELARPESFDFPGAWFRKGR